MKTTSLNIWNFFLLFAILAIFACVGFIYKIQKGVLISPRCIEVSAEVEKTVLADKATWSIVFDKVGDNQLELNQILQADKNKVQKFFIQKGIQNKDMEFSFFIHEEGRPRKPEFETRQSYRAGYNLTIKSDDVDRILRMRNDLSGLYSQGILLTHNRLTFGCSVDEKVKQELTIKAAQKALKKAEEMARALNIRIKKINKVYDPDLHGAFPLMTDGVFNNKAIMTSYESEIPDSVPQRKIKARIRMDVEIR